MQINKELLKKNKRLIYQLLIGLAISIMIAVALELAIFKNLYHQTTAIDRTLIVTAIIYFIGLHVILDIKSMYHFIEKKRYIIALVLLLFLVLLGYSGSSINMYDIYVPSQEKVNTEVLGKTRPIRSDEWAVNTPLVFSQNMDEKNNLPYFSSIVRGTQTDMFTVIHAPVADILMLAKPFTSAYFLGNDIGLSFWWYGRLIALLLVSFEFCMVITKKNKLVSLCGMLMIALAPATQWWYSNFLPDILIYGQLAIVLMDLWLKTDKLKVKILSAIGIFICAISYVFTFYPAWSIPFAYVFLAVFIGLIIQNKKNYHFHKRDALIMAIVILAVAGMGIRYYLISHDTIKSITGTSYPGERFEVGGDGIVNVFGYVYNMFTPYKNMQNP